MQTWRCIDVFSQPSPRLTSCLDFSVGLKTAALLFSFDALFFRLESGMNEWMKVRYTVCLFHSFLRWVNADWGFQFVYSSSYSWLITEPEGEFWKTHKLAIVMSLFSCFWIFIFILCLFRNTWTNSNWWVFALSSIISDSSFPQPLPTKCTLLQKKRKFLLWSHKSHISGSCCIHNNRVNLLHVFSAQVILWFWVS